jgi:OOP family OmpA-OmpF porin
MKINIRLTRFPLFLIPFIAAFAPLYLSAQDEKPESYSDSRKTNINVPFGKLAFADRVVSFQPGSPKSADLRQMNPKFVLGAPDFENEISTPYSFTSLGCGGVLTLAFTDNILSDLPGNDLYVFEAGQNVERIKIEISKDNQNWINTGIAQGNEMGIDISKVAKKNELFYYVRLTDVGSNCKDFTPGADVDAVAAVSSYKVISFANDRIFKGLTPHILPEAKDELDSLAKEVRQCSTCILRIQAGKGTPADSQLSRERSMALKEYLYDVIDDDDNIEADSFGKFSNTSTNRENQTIDIYFFGPATDNYKGLSEGQQDIPKAGSLLLNKPPRPNGGK